MRASQTTNKDTSSRNPFTKPIFLGTIRAIFDSKFNEFITENDYKNYSRFPEFVFSWLGKFTVNEDTR